MLNPPEALAAGVFALYFFFEYLWSTLRLKWLLT